ncbi:carbohydrate ABC transporter permease [Cryobacterium tepidiphilum]|jgi:multiple sugar transport system permease protein|nr:sugar ABC transporter permease [Cryobacterium tepidiphilum]
MSASSGALGTTRARRRPGSNTARTAVIALAPFVVFCLALGALPFARVVQMGLSKVDLGATGFSFDWIGIGNFQAVLANKDAWEALGNTAVFIIATMLGSIITGLVLALLVNRAVLMLPVARNVLIWPAVIAPVVVSLIWLLILSPTAGGLNKVLENLGLPGQTWLNSGHGAMLSLIALDIWHWTPVVFLFIYTALQSISEELLEAARMDGASEGQILRRVTLPLLAPAIGAVAVVRVVMGVKVFDEMYLLTSGGPNGATTLVSQRIQLWFFQDLNYGEAAAFSILVVAITIAILLLALFTRSRMAGRS